MIKLAAMIAAAWTAGIVIAAAADALCRLADWRDRRRELRQLDRQVREYIREREQRA